MPGAGHLCPCCLALSSTLATTGHRAKAGSPWTGRRPAGLRGAAGRRSVHCSLSARLWLAGWASCQSLGRVSLCRVTELLLGSWRVMREVAAPRWPGHTLAPGVPEGAQAGGAHPAPLTRRPLVGPDAAWSSRTQAERRPPLGLPGQPGALWRAEAIQSRTPPRGQAALHALGWRGWWRRAAPGHLPARGFLPGSPGRGQAAGSRGS